MQNPGPLNQNLHLDKISRGSNGHPGLRRPGLDPHVTSPGELGFFFPGSMLDGHTYKMQDSFINIIFLLH